MSNLITIFCDVDGVLADFQAGAMRLWGMAPENYPASEPVLWKGLNVTEAQFWKRIREAPEFWASLPVYPWTRKICGVFAGITAALGVPCTLLIGPDPASAPDYRDQRQKWISKHLPPGARHLIGVDKLRCASDESRPMSLLIDDNPNVCRAFRIAGGNALCFPNRLNGIIMREDDVANWFQDEMKRIIRGDFSRVGPVADARELPEFERAVT